MAYRLALDIGTASCGLVAVSLDAQGEPLDIVHHALHIFSEPLLPAKKGGVGEPKKSSRRAARMARRVIDRRSRRLKRIAQLASLLDIDHREVSPDRGQTLHRVRADAVVSKIGLDDLLRVMLKLAKRRGYAGEFKIRKDSKEGQVESGINTLTESMKALGGETTLGQYLYKRFKEGETLKLKEVGLYAHRSLLLKEFNAIWDEQQRHHSELNLTRPDPLDPEGKERPIRDQFRDAIFFQRPLKSVAPMVGNCSLEASLPRAPMAQPAMQAFRIEKQLSDLRWGMGRNAIGLSIEQRDAIRPMLNDPSQITKKEGKLSFKKIYARLEELDLMPSHHRSLNMERSSREDLAGNRTLRAFKDLGLLEPWQGLDRLTQVRVINFLADLGSPEQVDLPDWHKRFTKTEWIKDKKTGKQISRQIPRELDPKLVEFINTVVDAGKFDRLPNMGFETGRASYSVRALDRLTVCMQTEGIDEHGAVRRCYLPKERTGELLMHLPAHKPTGNVVVDVALGVVRRAVNEALAVLGEPPAEVVVELSRDMALGVKARGEIESKIDKNRKQRETARKALASRNEQGNERNILKYLLWEQQEHHCPYCSNRINLSQAVDGNISNLEHILPKTLTRVGRQRNHLVLAHRSCNDAKRDRTPYEAFGHDEDRWAAVNFCASVLEGNKQFAKARLLTIQDYEHEVLDDRSISEFSERQYAETSWIGKLTAQWMRETCTNVNTSRGTMTAHLRRIWKLETVIAQARFEAGLPVLDQDGEKITLDDFSRFKPFWEGHTSSSHPRTDRKIDKRIDHRHHLIDALVIAQTSISLYQRMAKHYKELAERRKSGEALRLSLQTEPPIRDLRDKALKLVKDTKIRHKADRYFSGEFFQDHAYRKTWTDEGKSRLVTRVSLIDLADKKGDVEKTRRSISDIVSGSTRHIVSDAFESRLSKGKTVKEALAEPIPDIRFNMSTPSSIKRVSVYQRIGRGFFDGSTAIRIEHTSRNATHEKHYPSKGYAYVSLILERGTIVSAESVTTFAANRRRSQPREDERRFFRGDTLQNPKNGKQYLIHQLLADAKVRVAELTEARSWIDLGAESSGGSFGAEDLIGLVRC